MKQRQFEKIHKPLWDRCEEILDGNGVAEPFELPSLHRRLCHSLSLVRSRGYSPSLADRLSRLANRSHARLYGAGKEPGIQMGAWLAGGFPRQVRREWRTVLLAHIVVWGGAVVAGLLVHWNPSNAEMFLGPGGAGHLKAMFAPGMERLGRQSSESDFAMFGYYIWHNVSILFRAFATGIFLGVPTLVVLCFNGVDLGASMAVMIDSPEHRIPFFSFVATHSALELTGIVIGGSSGLKLGWSVASPGRRSRIESFRVAATETLPVMACASVMVGSAAFFEGFWSANPNIPPMVRIGVGIAAWVSVYSYFLFAGRTRAAR